MRELAAIFAERDRGEMPAGGRVVIVTIDPKALDAVQQFLRFQIAEHKTGDPAAVS